MIQISFLNILYLLMWDLCQEKMAVFTKEVSTDGKDATNVRNL